MMKKYINKPIIIVASGNSIPFSNFDYYRRGFGIPIKLRDIIRGNYSIGLNHWYRYGCETTFTSFVDYQFYLYKAKGLKKLPLIIGSLDPSLKNHNIDKTHKNTILLENSGIYNGKNSIEKGVYCKQLVGIWSLSLAISLGFKEIYLLGYDACEINGKTHFYQGLIDINKTYPVYIKGKKVHDKQIFPGVGKNEKGKYKTSTYNNACQHLNKKWFAPFKNEKDINIYNVSPNSAITVFPKIDYEEFYKRVKNNHIWQTDAREEIKQIIKERT